MTHKIFKRALLLAVALSMAALLCLPALAYSTNSKDFIKVWKTDNYIKNGKYYVGYDYQNVTDQSQNVDSQNMYYSAALYNSSGKVVETWSRKAVAPGSGRIKNGFTTDYSKLPAGQYTFALTFQTQIMYGNGWQQWTWRTTVNHQTQNISFGAAERKMSSNGAMRNVFNVNCKNIQGKALTIEIFDQYQYLVYKDTGPARKTNNETGWFAWDGWPSTGGLKCTSGQYTVKISYPGGTPIQKSYNLTI